MESGRASALRLSDIRHRQTVHVRIIVVRRVLPIITAALLVVACRAEDPPTFAEAAPVAAREALISADDLPPGWREGSEGTLERADLEESCDVLTPEGAFPDAAATASSPSFATSDQRSVQSFSAVYASAETAATAVSALDAKVERCRDDFLDEIRRLAKEEIKASGLDLGPFADIDVSLEQVPLDDTGDEAVIYQIEVDVSVFGTQVGFNTDVALIRRGQVISALVYSAYTPTATAEEKALLVLALERLTAATEKLS